MIDEKVLIERLEEEYNKWCDIYNKEIHKEYADGTSDGLHKAIEIVNQLAEEHNNGWIPCSERLPEIFEKVQVTYLGFHDNKPYSNGNTAFIDETGSWCWVKGSHNVNVQIIAWRENLAPYQPKGEQP